MNHLLTYLETFIRFRIETELGAETVSAKPSLELGLVENPGLLEQIMPDSEFSEEEIVICLLAIVPHIEAGFITRIITSLLPAGGEFAEFGGIKGKTHRDEREHLYAFGQFISITEVSGKSLLKWLREKNWAKFAYGYNGADYAKNNYDIKLEKAYNKYK